MSASSCIKIKARAVNFLYWSLYLSGNWLHGGKHGASIASGCCFSVSDIMNVHIHKESRLLVRTFSHKITLKLALQLSLILEWPFEEKRWSHAYYIIQSTWWDVHARTFAGNNARTYAHRCRMIRMDWLKQKSGAWWATASHTLYSERDSEPRHDPRSATAAQTIRKNLERDCTNTHLTIISHDSRVQSACLPCGTKEHVRRQAQKIATARKHETFNHSHAAAQSLLPVPSHRMCTGNDCQPTSRQIQARSTGIKHRTLTTKGMPRHTTHATDCTHTKTSNA